MAIHIPASGNAPPNQVRAQWQAPERGDHTLYRHNRPIEVADGMPELSGVLNGRYKTDDWAN